MTKYYGEKKRSHYSLIFEDAVDLKEGADTNLKKIIENDLYPEIIRSTAVRYLSRYSTDISGPVVFCLHTAVLLYLFLPARQPA